MGAKDISCFLGVISQPEGGGREHHPVGYPVIGLSAGYDLCQKTTPFFRLFAEFIGIKPRS